MSVPYIGYGDNTMLQPWMIPSYDPTAWNVGLSRGELKQLSKIGGLPIIYGERVIKGITV